MSPRLTLRFGKRVRFLVNYGRALEGAATTDFLQLRFSKTEPHPGAWAVLLVASLCNVGVQLMLETDEFDALAREALA